MSSANNSTDDEKRQSPLQVEVPSVIFPVAGIGASAGGLEAIKTLLENLPDDTGIAYVIIQHLAPDHPSILAELLEKKTSMKIQTVKDKMPIRPNHIYVIPPNTYLNITDRHLTLLPRKKKESLFLPINFFFKSLARVYRNKAIGILLSGTGSDGTAGVRDIKAEGGITFAQDNSARFNGMPRSAIDTGYIDFILPASRIGKELKVILDYPYTLLFSDKLEPANDADLRKILILLHHKKGVDFSLYKCTTINRRILRRMVLNHKRNLQEYAQLLQENDVEVDQLYQDLLINVTSFFREPIIFQVLFNKIFPQLFKDRKPTEDVRIWVAACATGEEAYSLAMLLFEFISEKRLNIPVQIFATDLNEKAIEKARAGIYSQGSVDNISEERLKRFFIKTDGSFQVIKSIRDVCVFAPHNLLTDPPFSRMDMVSCQNVMIYFETSAQRKILKAFHYALKSTGFLLLGKSETTGASTDLFAQAEKTIKIYTKKELPNHFEFDFNFPDLSANKPIDTNELGRTKAKESDVGKEADRLLLSQYVPASVVVNSDLQIVRFFGPVTRFLQPPSGKVSWDLLKMVRDDLIVELRSLVYKARKEGVAVKKEGIYLDAVGNEISLEVVPVPSPANESCFLILFRESSASKVNRAGLKGKTSKKAFEDQKIHNLERELREAKEQIRTMGEEFESTREELQSANEEVLSSNVELQIINGELETSKEELQSTNEELITINEELHSRNDDLKEAFQFREAIVETIREPLLVLNSDLRVMTANRAFYKTFRQDPPETEGFFIYEMNNEQWNIPALQKQLLEILSKNQSFHNFELIHTFPELGERIILFSGIKLFSEENKRSRILLVIEDITLRRTAEENLKQALKINTSILNSISDIFISVDKNWNFNFINKQAEEYIGKNGQNLLGKNLWEILTNLLDSVFHKELVAAMKTKTFSQFEFFDDRMKEWYHFRIYPSDEMLSIYANRITTEKLSQQLIRESKERYENFIYGSTEGIWRFEFKQPVSVLQHDEKQIEEIMENAFIAECNQAMAKMYGYKDGNEMIGANMKELTANHDDWEALLLKFIQFDYRLADVESCQTKEGEKRYFLNNLTGIVENDKIVRIWGMQRNITEKKQTEEALRKTRNQLNFALAAGSVGTFIWDIKTNKITWTKVQESLYGLQEYPFKGTFEDWLRFIYPEDIEATRKAIGESLAEQKELSIEFRIIWPDKSIHWIMSRANISYDKEGNPSEMNGINIDISERKFREQIIEANEERFRTLLQNSFDVITVFNYDGTITYQSDSIERVLGYASRERLGMNIFKESLIHTDDREIAKKLYRKCIEHPYQYFQTEYRMIHNDGGYRIMEVGAINLAKNSSIHGIIINYRDITERRMVEKQKEEFIGIASHELKTPVTSIKAYAQILHDSLLEKKDFASADLLARMDHQIDRLTSLIKDLLDVTKITEGQLVLKYQEYDLNELINQVVDEMQMTTKKHLILKELDNLKPIKGDEERTAQVIVNLISNAIKYSPKADKVIIRTTAGPEEVTVCVQDFGIGISKEMQKRLFKRFFRVNDETNSTFPGLGLGLFISTEIVKRQRGRIWVESAPNEGSTFCFALPYS